MHRSIDEAMAEAATSFVAVQDGLARCSPPRSRTIFAGRYQRPEQSPMCGGDWTRVNASASQNAPRRTCDGFPA
jgi:hypothetical protein